MKNFGKIHNHSRLVMLTQLTTLTVLSFFIFAGVTYSAVYDDELPIPYEQLSFKGNIFDISGWPTTRNLTKVEIVGSMICFENNIGSSWHEPSGQGVNANVHMAMNYNGTWIASPWDYMGVGQLCKHAESVGGIPYSGWKPTRGQKLYFFLTGISRDSSGGVNQERTNVVEYVWGGGAGYPPPLCQGPPVINSFTANPDLVQGGPLGLLGDAKDHNVVVSWNVSNAESVELVINNGDSSVTKNYNDTQMTLELLIDSPTTFTLRGKLACTPEADWPWSAPLSIDYRSSKNNAGANLLLINSSKTP